MRRFYKDVRRLDRGETTIRNFAELVFGTIDSLPEISAVYRIYKEDGGKRYTYEDFKNAFPEIKASDALEEKACRHFAIYGGEK